MKRSEQNSRKSILMVFCALNQTSIEIYPIFVYSVGSYWIIIYILSSTYAEKMEKFGDKIIKYIQFCRPPMEICNVNLEGMFKLYILILGTFYGPFWCQYIGMGLV